MSLFYRMGTIITSRAPSPNLRHTYPYVLTVGSDHTVALPSTSKRYRKNSLKKGGIEIIIEDIKKFTLLLKNTRNHTWSYVLQTYNYQYYH
jgi:hypothetical protein